MKDINYKIAIVFFLCFTFFWIYIHFLSPYNNDNYQLFAALYGLMALVGALNGLFISRMYGGLKSIIGKSLLMFSLGLIAQELGQLSYSFYIYYLHVSVPYPSIGDVGYFSSIFFYIYGVILLAKAAGLKVALQSFSHKISAIAIPLLMLIFSYIFFLRGYVFDWNDPLKVFLDFGYPLGQAFYISLAILTFTVSRGILGGLMKDKVRFIILALVAQYLADYIFLYQAQKGTWYAGGVNDYMYLISYFLMSIGLIQFKSIYKRLHIESK